jgi:hypothetical protein
MASTSARLGTATKFLDLPGHGLELTIIGNEVAHSDVGPGPCECKCDGPPDSPPGTGNDGYFTL